MSSSENMTILILAANPLNTTRVRLDQEMRDIEEGLKLSPSRDKFIVHQRHAVRLKDIRRALLEYNPQIIHFCGHSNQNGIVVEDENGNALIVEPNALADLFRLFEDQIQCVLLNSCFSVLQAQAINQHIKYVIGMHDEIGDKAAIEFAVGFYDALGAGRHVAKAYDFGRNAIQLYGLSGHLIPILLIRSSPSPQQLIECIRGKQKQYVKESYGEMAHECFTDDDLDEFIRKRVVDKIIQDLAVDYAFADIVFAVKNISANEQAVLLEAASNTYKATWAELGGIDRTGQTEAGQTAEKMIASAICNLVKRQVR